MSIYTEREMLKYLLECIQEEKRVIREMYRDIKHQEVELLNRVREIDNIGRNETRGVYDVQGLISDLSETLNRVSGLIPKIPIDVVLSELRSSVSGGEDSVVLLDKEENKVVKNEIYQQEKKDAIYRENKKSIGNRKERPLSSKFNAKTHGKLLIRFLEEKGRPVSTNEIKDFLSDGGFTEGNTSNRMTAMMKRYPKISKVGHGFYQYNPSG